MWCSISYSERYSDNISINEYLKAGWKIIATDEGNDVFLYHLQKKKELLTCQYSPASNKTVCWRP